MVFGKKLVVAFLVLQMVTMSVFQANVFAFDAEINRLRHLGVRFYDPADFGCEGRVDVGSKNASIYVIGDSLTVGMRDAGNLESKLTSRDLTVNKIEATEGINVANSIGKLEFDKDIIKNSDSVLIGLGTNPENNFASKVEEMVSKVKDASFNPNAQIFWINVADSGGIDATNINATLKQRADALDFKIIDWASEYANNSANYEISGDGIHHSASGYEKRADWISAQLNTESGREGVIRSGCSCGGGSPLAGNSSVEQAFNFFLRKNSETSSQNQLSREQIAGIIGNLMVESGLDPLRTQIGGGPGRGIAQWTVDERWAVLLKFAENNQKDPLTLETQLSFVWFEMTNEPPTAGVDGGKENSAFLDLQNQTTVPDATRSFLTKYERAGVPHLDRRIEEAEKAFAVGESINYSSGSSPTCGGIGGGAGSLDNFPMIVTKSELQEGIEGGIWCYQATSNCHHDYNAADIHAPVGTPIVAAKSGTVVSARNAVGGVGSRVVILGSDGGYTYYYTHMAANSLQVEKDDEVSAGQQIGAVGDRAQAVGTAPHLHFDLLPQSEYKFRPPCSSGGCAKYPFVDIQPWLAEIYKSLPN